VDGGVPEMAALLFAVRALLFCLGSLCYALLNVLSQLSKEPDGSYAYSMPTVVLSAELVKLCLSVGFLVREVGSPVVALRTIGATPATTWFHFAMPAVLYAVNNNLDMLNNQYMDPATESVLVQLKILTTGLAWWLVFKQPIGRRKWLALVLLFVGCCGAGWPTTSSDRKQNAMYIEPFGVVLVAMYVVISATAGVYNEWLYKNLGRKDSIHVCNIRIYTVGSLFCLLTHFSTNSRGGDARLLDLWKGYNVYTWSLVVTYSMMGLLLAQVMKFFDSIVKLFISGSSMYASALLTVTIFDRVPSPMFMGSMVLVTLAILLYNVERILPLLQRSHEA